MRKLFLLAVCIVAGIAMAEPPSINVEQALAEKEYGRAKSLAEECSESDGKCTYLLAQIYQTGLAGEKDPSQALTLIHNSAELGYPTAQSLLGSLYFQGVGVPKDIEVGESWWIKSAKNCSVYAQSSLANFYFVGNHLKQNTKQALYWAIVAAAYSPNRESAISKIEVIESALDKTSVEGIYRTAEAFITNSGCGTGAKPVYFE